MLKKLFCVYMLFSAGLLLFAQNTDQAPVFRLTGNLTGIYSLGNAALDQMLTTGTGNGAYENRKNGYYIATNLYAWFRPVPFFEGCFKLYNVGRPGSFYVPLSLEANSEQNFSISLDRVFGRVSVLEALDLSPPWMNIYLKTGKYKGEAARYNVLSKFDLENIMYKMETGNTYNYEFEVQLYPKQDDFTVAAAFIGNYRFDEGIQRLYDNDGGVAQHGRPVMGDNGIMEYAPQFMAYLRFWNLDLAGSKLKGDFIYGQNVSDIYSGNNFGLSLNFDLAVDPDSFIIPIGLGFAMYEKNIDVLGRTADTARLNETYDFRNTMLGALSFGIRLTNGDFGFNMNAAGVYANIEHIYRDPLQIISMSVDIQGTFINRYFIGAGFVAGTLTDAVWKTKSIIDPALDSGGYDHTFNFIDNFGYEIYGGLKFRDNCQFVIGFNENRGLSMNYNLENKPEGLIKYKLADTNYVVGELPKYQTSGMFIKFIMGW
jgi:hypothetical protein